MSEVGETERSASFHAAVDALSTRLPEREHLLLCVDYDGTLAPVVDDPDAARIRPESREALRDLHRHPRVSVAVVSGRALDDVRGRVDLPGVTYAGNQGLELRVEGTTKVHPVAETYQRDVEGVAARLRDAFEADESVFVEEKGQTLSVHHRRASDDRTDSVRRRVAGVVGEMATETLTVRGAAEVIEVRPAVDWDKGSVVSLLVREHVSCLPVFVGDSRTDESAFRAVERDGVGVRVGETDPAATAATEFVRGPAEAAALLDWLRRTGVGRLGSAASPSAEASDI